LLPSHLIKEIDYLNDWIHETINNGVYRVGFATSQSTYDAYILVLFESLDRLEMHLGEPGHAPYLFGEWVTESDVRLFTTLIRFDVVYYTLFKCNLKMVRYDYPRLHTWMRRLYWGYGATGDMGGNVFRRTTLFDAVRICYPIRNIAWNREVLMMES
jgi:glutathionyl-hydroquinone reductase